MERSRHLTRWIVLVGACLLTGCANWTYEGHISSDPWEAYETTEPWDGREPMGRGFQPVATPP